MSELEKIYYNLSILTDDFEDSVKILGQRNELHEYLEAAGIASGKQNAKQLSELEEYIGELIGLYNKHGFIFGFKYAMKLMAGGMSEGMIP